MDGDTQSFEVFVRSELAALQTRLLDQYAATRRTGGDPSAKEALEASDAGWLPTVTTTQVCGRRPKAAEPEADDSITIQVLQDGPSSPMSFAEAMQQVLPDEEALNRTTVLLEGLGDFEGLESGGSPRSMEEKAVLYEDPDVLNPKAVASWALLLDSLSTQYELDFEHVGTGCSAFLPSRPRQESELELNIRSVWTTPMSKKGAMVLRAMNSRYSLSTEEEDEKAKATSSLKGEGLLDKIVLHPYRLGRVSWGLLTLMVVAWEALVMPLLLFDLGSVSVVLSSLTSAMLAFWIVDIIVNCITGVDRGGVIHLRFSTSFWAYSTTWMLPDLLIVAIDVVVYLAVADDAGETTTSAGSQGMRMARALRLLRLIRLLRIYKASSAAGFLVDYIRSPVVLIASKIAWTLMTILFINHYIACGWCAIAYFNVGSYTWIMEQQLESAAFLELYLSSLHWSLTQFSPATNNIGPQNLLERSVAAFVVIFALLVFSSFVSSITNHMNQLRITNARMIEEDMQLRNFFEKRLVSVDLSGRIQHLFKKGNGMHLKRPHLKDIPFLQDMPESLQIHLHNELFMHTFKDMPAFGKVLHLDRSLFSKICRHAFQEQFYPASFEVFVDGSSATRAIINVSGDLNYSWVRSAWDTLPVKYAASHATTVIKVPLGAWLAEAVLWSEWNHRGLLESASPSEILVLDASSFTSLCHSHGGPVYNLLRKVAILSIAYREHLSRTNAAVTDLPLSENTWKSILDRATKLQTMNTVINAMTRVSLKRPF